MVVVSVRVSALRIKLSAEVGAVRAKTFEVAGNADSRSQSFFRSVAEKQLRVTRNRSSHCHVILSTLSVSSCNKIRHGCDGSIRWPCWRINGLAEKWLTEVKLATHRNLCVRVEYRFSWSRYRSFEEAFETSASCLKARSCPQHCNFWRGDL